MILRDGERPRYGLKKETQLAHRNLGEVDGTCTVKY
jgi:hypothetical protein